jgi:DNA-binding NarL/FixJ family response regulator
MINVGLIEDNESLRDNYIEFLEMNGSFKVLWYFDSIEDTLKSTIQDPKVILFDINLRGISAIEGFQAVKNKFPNSLIIMLTAHDANSYVKELLKLGANGYILKTSSMLDIQKGIEAVIEGGFSISPNAAKHLIADYRFDPIEELRSKLTKREFELVQLLAEGLSYKQAADRLFVTKFTINQHLKHIYAKLGIKSKAELMAKMIK